MSVLGCHWLQRVYTYLVGYIHRHTHSYIHCTILCSILLTLHFGGLFIQIFFSRVSFDVHEKLWLQLDVQSNGFCYTRCAPLDKCVCVVMQIVCVCVCICGLAIRMEENKWTLSLLKQVDVAMGYLRPLLRRRPPFFFLYTI